MQRKWQREWKRNKPDWAKCQPDADKNVDNPNLTLRLARKLLPPVAAASLLLATMTGVYANPTGGQVMSGAGTIAQSGNTVTITQSTNKLSVNWQSFNIGSSETVNFLQPGASSIALNRVLGNNASSIYGHLNANGQVFLINPNGVLFARGAQVNVGGLVASTQNISDSNFQAGNYKFSGNGGSVVNQGTITAANGGYVALLGGKVSNQGVIVAQQGTVALGAGNATTLDFNGDGLLSLAVNQSALGALAENKNLIQADGGTVLMTASAADRLAGTVVNNSGVIQAQSVNNVNGVIRLDGGTNGKVVVGGTLDASAPNGGDGGFIETSGAHVQIRDSVNITTSSAFGKNGTWLIDPVDFTIAASGGDMTGATLSQQLDNGNVTIASSQGGSGSHGNINVDDDVSWSAGNTLTLNAYNNININAEITATQGTLNLYYGQGAANGVISGTAADYYLGSYGVVNLSAGQHFNTKLGSGGAVTAFTVITDRGSEGDENSSGNYTLQGLANSSMLAGNYVLGADIDGSVLPGTAGWNSGEGFTPIGDSSTPFSGNFDGLGHTIGNVTINNSTAGSVGIFGGSSGTIRNVILDGCTVSSSYSGSETYVGALVGYNSGNVSNSIVYDSIVTSTGGGGSTYTGGLVGINDVGGTITDCGFMGYSESDISNPDVVANTPDGAQNGNNGIGGLVGYNDGMVKNSFFMGTVEDGANSNGGDNIGGLVGKNDNLGTVETSFSGGDVIDNTTNGGDNIGGLVGDNNGGTVQNSFSASAVTDNSSDGGDNIGGLVGMNNGGTVQNSYSAGQVTDDSESGGDAIGGLVGYNRDVEGPAVIQNSYWYTTDNPSTSVGSESDIDGVSNVAGVDASGMVNPSTYSGWDMATSGGSTAVWRIYDGYTAPLLRCFLTPLTVTANNATAAYSGTPYTGNAGVTYSIPVEYDSPYSLPPAYYALGGTLTYGGSSQGAVNAGTYTITPSGLYTTFPFGYDISYASGTLTITGGNTDYSNYIPRVNTPPATPDNNPHVQIVQGGINSPIAIAPSGLSLTTVGGGTQGLTADFSGNAMTIKFDGANSGSGAAPATNSDVALVSVGTGGMQAKDYYKVASSSDSVTMTAGGAAASALPKEPSQSSPSTTFSLNTPDGQVAQFQVLYADGAISIKPLNDIAAALESNSKKLVAAAAMLAAQQDLSVNAPSVAAIYLH